MLHPHSSALRISTPLTLLMAAVLTACGGGNTVDANGTTVAAATTSPVTGTNTTITVTPAAPSGGTTTTTITGDASTAGSTGVGDSTGTATATGDTATAVTPVAVTPTTPVTPVAVPPVTPVTPVATSLMPVIDNTKLILAAAGSATMDVAPTTEIAPDSGGEFRTSCTPSHMSYDDPLVYPGQPGRSHLHTFFGNTGTDANTTLDTLRNTGRSTCRGGIANRSGYWVPTMVDTKDGTPIVPDSIGVYYKSGVFDGTQITPIPAGLRMIAGNAAATGAADAGASIRWKCIGGPNNENDKYGSQIANCDVGAQLWQEVGFPQCWDGVNLDSPDHKSHMSFTVNVWAPPRPVSEGGAYQIAVCPSTHPVIIPAITFNVLYNVTSKDAPLRWRLSSDNYDTGLPGGYSSHGDWFNGWNGDVSNAWGTHCLQGKKDCHSHLLADGRMIF